MLQTLIQLLKEASDPAVLREEAAKMRQPVVASWRCGSGHNNVSLITHATADLLDTGANLFAHKRTVNELKEQWALRQEKGEERPRQSIESLLMSAESLLDSEIAHLDACAELLEEARHVAETVRDDDPRVINWMSLAELQRAEVTTSLSRIQALLSKIRDLIERGCTIVQVSRCCR